MSCPASLPDVVDLPLVLSYVVHVVAGAFWVGAVLYAAYAVVPVARTGALSPAAFETTVDRLLTVTRWTGLALPVTGLYQIWVLYPTARLFGTTRGHLVLAMLVLWTAMNGLLEVAVYRVRTAAGGAPGLGAYLAEGLTVDGGIGDADVPRLAAAARPYMLAAVALGILLLVDAGLLAYGGPLL